MSARHVIYATTGWGIHDRRWVEALEACGFVVQVFNANEDLREMIDQFEPSAAPVLAGPLTTVTRSLVGLRRPIFGLSWGYDLQQDHSQAVAADELTWISALSGLVVDSPATRDIAIGLGLASERIVLIPWGVDLELFAPEGPAVSATDLGFPPVSKVVLSLRTHDHLYRTTDVIEAFDRAARSDSSLVLVMGGDGPLTQAHRARVEELGLNDRVRFIGRIDEAELPALLRGADFYVTASETDGTSVTLLQAMACGTPVIASRNAGNASWIIDQRTGLTFAVGDVHALAFLLAAGGRSSQSADITRRARELVIAEADWSVNRRQLREVLNAPPTGWGRR
jgi:glycosyltransferase involved in cell wall biosynthesis